jgi:transposase
MTIMGGVAKFERSLIRKRCEEGIERAKRKGTKFGIGPISATAIAALAPPVETFAKGRDFAAWLGLMPLQRSTGGKQKLGATSKMGERTLRRLLIIGSATGEQTRRAKRGLGSNRCWPANRACW